MLFEDLSLSKSIQRAVFEEGYTNPTPIQEKAIPIVLAGKDLVGCAQTGTGKTAAFAIPIIHHLHRMVGSSKNEANSLFSGYANPRVSRSNRRKFWHLRQIHQFKTIDHFWRRFASSASRPIEKGVDILIATPGRLLDLHKQGF